jgi:hypothetical protein
VAAVKCDVCDGTGVLDAGVDPETGLYGGTDCWGCAGTGDTRNHDDSPYRSDNYPERDSA